MWLLLEGPKAVTDDTETRGKWIPRRRSAPGLSESRRRGLAPVTGVGVPTTYHGKSNVDCSQGMSKEMRLSIKSKKLMVVSSFGFILSESLKVLHHVIGNRQMLRMYSGDTRARSSSAGER